MQLLRETILMKKILIIHLFTLAALTGLSQKATATCTFGNSTLLTSVMPLRISNITVGRDVSIGGEIYRQHLETNHPGFLICRNELFFEYTNKFITTPMSLAGLSTGPYAQKTYNTGVSGIGVVIRTAQDGIPYVIPQKTPQRRCSFIPAGSSCTVSLPANLEIVLIKTSNTIGNGTISAASLPTIEIGLIASGVNTPFLRASFSGAINVVSRTCLTPNVEVDMGTYKVNDLAQPNSATPWKDFSITLNNCPAFYGSNPTAAANIPNWGNRSGTPINFVGVHQNNSIQVNLIGTVPPINANQGILALNPVGATSGQPATGVGIQVANSAGTPVAIGLGTWIASGITTQAVDGMSYTIPLKARYLKTTGPIGPGQANATAQFTINYQ